MYKKVGITSYEMSVGGVRVPQGMSYTEAMDFCEWLTKRIRNKLPKEYVVRLPTEAEWEYALMWNEIDENSPYRKWELKADAIRVSEDALRKMSNNLDQRKVPWHDLMPGEVGRKAPNGFGLYDMLGAGYEIMLDTIDDDSFVIKGAIMATPNKNQNGRRKRSITISCMPTELYPTWCLYP